jgi:CRISPR-associated exonuclease Cas4
VGWRSDAAAAEQMVELIAERRLGGAEGEVLLIEEPELMLTPQQQRHLYDLMRRYAEKNQVIYSTRAPALLDATYFHEIVRLDRTAGGTRVRRARPELLNDYQRLRVEAEFDHERTEMFFASAVLLVEGQTERLSMPLIFRRLGHDPDALGISIVEVGGKGNLGLVGRVLAAMGIPHVIVHDQDRGRQSAADNAEIRREAGDAPVFMLQPDFEAEAGIKHVEDKVFDSWRRFSKIDPEDIPDIFKRIVETTVRLATGG